MTALLSNLAIEDDQVAPGLLGFLVVAALAVATWFLIKSMNKQLRKINFEEKPPADQESAHREDEHRHT